MKSLIKLWLLKKKGIIRNLFKSKLIGIFTIIIILFYGIIIVSSFTVNNSQVASANTVEMHKNILILIGFLALILFTVLMQSKKALFYGEDAFYLFSGPFTRKQIMSYLTFQTVTQAFMQGLFALFIFVVFTVNTSYSPIFILLAYLTSVITVLFFLILTDYLYILSIGNNKYQKYTKLIPIIMIGSILIIVFAIYIQTGNFQTLFVNFVQSDLFYAVPIFGWQKLVLIAYVEQSYILIVLGLTLLMGVLGSIYFMFINYKGDFYEQALQDAITLSKRIKDAKSGNQDALQNFKIKKTVSSSFKKGAYAVMSKNILLMKKTNNFIGKSDLIIVGIYIAVTIMMDMGFGVFRDMMFIWLFSSLQNSDLAKELKNYQIYLIPDKPFNKMIAIVIPTFIKTSFVTAISFIAMGIYYQASVTIIFSYWLDILGYICIFISGSVLSVRLLKSRSSPMFEGFIKIIIILISAFPSFIVINTVYKNDGIGSIIQESYIMLLINFIISILILYRCKKMMNGRELTSE